MGTLFSSFRNSINKPSKSFARKENHLLYFSFIKSCSHLLVDAKAKKTQMNYICTVKNRIICQNLHLSLIHEHSDKYLILFTISQKYTTRFKTKVEINLKMNKQKSAKGIIFVGTN